jgi:hypothetical protein
LFLAQAGNRLLACVGERGDVFLRRPAEHAARSGMTKSTGWPS